MLYLYVYNENCMKLRKNGINDTLKPLRLFINKVSEPYCERAKPNTKRYKQA